MKYPIDFKTDTWLKSTSCDQCDGPMPENEFVSLAIGATQDYAKDDVVDLSATEVTFQLDWQGPQEQTGTGFPVVKNTVDGGCCLNFCSSACLRAFLNDCVDNLDRLIEKEKSQPSLGE